MKINCMLDRDVQMELSISCLYSLRFSNIHCDQVFLKPKYGQTEKATEEKQC